MPKELKVYFEFDKENFQVSKFEQYMLNDLLQYDENSQIKLNRNVTKDFYDEMKLYHDQKRNLRFSIKGETRDGKSLIALKISDIKLELQQETLLNQVTKIVCGNQVEYRLKLKNAKFGDFYIIDENFFFRGGLGGNIETSQLKDYNSQIAKFNISLIFITPEKFLPVGATLGLSTYGRDNKNWLTRALVYKFKDNFSYLIGYIIIDIGELFRKYNCFLYKHIGGCNNLNRVDVKDIPKTLLKHSTCIPKNYDEKDLVNDKQTCPFYNICKHPICEYEHKKDTWIKKEMTGGLDDRTSERFKIALVLIHELISDIIIEKNSIRLNAKSGNDLKNKVRMKLHKYTNTKMGIGEFDELVEMVKSFCDIETLCETLKLLKNEKLKDKFFSIPNHGTYFKEIYDNLENKTLLDV